MWALGLRLGKKGRGAHPGKKRKSTAPGRERKRFQGKKGHSKRGGWGAGDCNARRVMRNVTKGGGEFAQNGTRVQLRRKRPSKKVVTGTFAIK